MTKGEESKVLVIMADMLLTLMGRNPNISFSEIKNYEKMLNEALDK